MVSVNTGHRDPSPPVAPGASAFLAACLAGLALLVLGASVWLLARTAADPGRSGRFTALFPPAWSAEERFAALAAADTRPVRESWIPGAVELEAEAPDVAKRLEAEGARLVLPGLGVDLLASGGCSGGNLADYPDRPALRKLRSGPM